MALALVALLHSAVAEARDEAERWAPSFSVFFDGLGQKAEGSVSTGNVLGAPLDPFDAEQDAFAPGNGCLRRSGVAPNFTFTRDNALCATARPNSAKILPDSASDDTSVSPLVGASIELMTPSPLEGFLRPRLFVRGDVAVAFAFERNLAGTESPSEFALPADIRIPGGQTPDDLDLEELTIVGQGSRTRMQVRPLVLSGGVGVAFSFDVFRRRVRLKPSFEYLRQELDLIGVVHRAVKLRIPSGAADLSGFRLISLTRVEKEWYDGIGPGLELEVDTARLGPFISSVFVMGRGYHLFGDLDTTLTQTNEFGETASWTIDLDSWVWRSGVGFRLRWSPEE